jgi:hypothetical protein
MMQLLIISFLIYAISIVSLIHNPSILRKTCVLNCAKGNDLTLDISYNSDKTPKIVINSPKNNRIILQFPPCDNIVWDNGEILWDITDEDDRNNNTTSVLVVVPPIKPIMPETILSTV